VVDGPLYNNCPGEALTPPELFLAAIASCGVELMHVIAKDQNLPLQHAAIAIDGFVDRDKQPRSDVTLFNSVQLRARLRGVSRDQATIVVEGFRKRCPIFGTVSAAALETIVEYEVE
jgi:uncharacterized OsmC-like protein